MLDIYFLSNENTSTESNPDESAYAGSIDLEQHRSVLPVLDACERSGIRLPFFEDSAFSLDDAKKFLSCLRSNQHLVSGKPSAAAALTHLEEILNEAIIRSTGFRAFCD